MTRFKTEIADSFCQEAHPEFVRFLREVDIAGGLEASELLDAVRGRLTETKAMNSDGPEELINDLYVIEKYLDFLQQYGQVWRLVSQREFGNSWHRLQDCLDSLRLIRKFSGIDILQFEAQLLTLEKCYPYNVFFSIGASVDHFECSVCGNDIDSFECVHRKGELYSGRMAYGIARNITNFNHIAMVDQPADKRCVVSYADDGPQFKLLRFLSELLNSRAIPVLQFGRLEFSKRLVPNPEHRKLARNEPCYCRSGKKFKSCCSAQAFMEIDHVDIVAQAINLELAVA